MKTRIPALLATLIISATLAVTAAAQCACGCGGGNSCGCGPAACGPRVSANSDPAKGVRATASATATATAVPKNYPLATCLVSGKKLGSMGAPYVFTYGQHGQPRTIVLCSKQYLPAFLKDSAKYLGALDAAAQKTSATQVAAN